VDSTVAVAELDSAGGCGGGVDQGCRRRQWHRLRVVLTEAEEI
jgi:hypothetical protein